MKYILERNEISMRTPGNELLRVRGISLADGYDRECRTDMVGQEDRASLIFFQDAAVVFDGRFVDHCVESASLERTVTLALRERGFLGFDGEERPNGLSVGNSSL